MDEVATKIGQLVIGAATLLGAIFFLMRLSEYPLIEKVMSKLPPALAGLIWALAIPVCAIVFGVVLIKLLNSLN